MRRKDQEWHNMKARLRFVHIPRCGGMTTYKACNGFFVSASEMGPGYWENIEGGWYRNLANNRLIGSHWPYIEGSTFHTITCLRNPIERGLSVYRQAKRLEGGHLHNPLWCEYVGQGAAWYCENSVWVRNAMTRQLAGVPIPTPGPVTEQSFNVALYNLRSCKIVGVTEDLDGFIRRVCAYLEKRCPSQIPSVNRVRRKISEDDEVAARRILEEENQWDLRLWMEAREIAS